MVRDQYPAWGKTCHKCGNRIHIDVSQVCKAKLYSVREGTKSDLENTDAERVCAIDTICSVPNSHKGMYCNMVGHKETVMMQIDCGATVNVLPRKYIGNNLIHGDKINCLMWDGSSKTTVGKVNVMTSNPKTGEDMLL